MGGSPSRVVYVDKRVKCALPCEVCQTACARLENHSETCLCPTHVDSTCGQVCDRFGMDGIKCSRTCIVSTAGGPHTNIHRCSNHLVGMCLRKCHFPNAETGMACGGDCVLDGEHASLTSPCACVHHGPQIPVANQEAVMQARMYEADRELAIEAAEFAAAHECPLVIVQIGGQGRGKTAVRFTVGAALTDDPARLKTTDVSAIRAADGNSATTMTYNMIDCCLIRDNGTELPIVRVADSPGIRWHVPDGASAADVELFNQSKLVLAGYLAGLEDGTQILDERDHHILIGSVDQDTGEPVELEIDADNAPHAVAVVVSVADLVVDEVVVTRDDRRADTADIVSCLARLSIDGTIAKNKAKIIVTHADLMLAYGATEAELMRGLASFGFSRNDVFFIHNYSSADELPRAATHATAMRCLSTLLCQHRQNIKRVIKKRAKLNAANPEARLALVGPFPELWADPERVLN